MKTLALLRHGKSSWDDVSLRDFDRPLSKRGRTASELIGAEMKHRGLVFELVLASPAERVRQTITYVTRGYGSHFGCASSLKSTQHLAKCCARSCVQSAATYDTS